MHILRHAILLAASTTSTTTKSSSSSGSSYATLIFLLVVVVIVYFLLIRPRQARMRQQRSVASSMEVGDEVVSIGGITGRVVDMDGDSVDVEVSPGIVLNFLRRAVNPRSAVVQGGAQQARAGSDLRPSESEAQTSAGDLPDWPDDEPADGEESSELPGWPEDAPDAPHDSAGEAPAGGSAEIASSEDAATGSDEVAGSGSPDSGGSGSTEAGGPEPGSGSGDPGAAGGK